MAEIVEPRYEELFNFIRDELRRSGFEEAIAAGIVLTGGSAKMEGAVLLAEEVFHVPVRLGFPQGISGLPDVVNNPIHATGVGLLLYARAGIAQEGLTRGSVSSVKGFFDRLRDWFKGYF